MAMHLKITRTIRLTPEMDSRLRTHAEGMGIADADVMRLALNQFLKAPPRRAVSRMRVRAPERASAGVV